MLYTRWRNKTTDLMKECQTYQERFEQVKDKNTVVVVRHSNKILKVVVTDLKILK